ncbi:hypothetical protein HCH_05309 [Hahella chejuensis KCTC 2396]|uniref:Uncharacterized protein n=1 Tax=Hahella chejuensis (strain KCTC 2396) TaxID=349521 RepID=Q2SBJ3_HAHCH|nr:hypothetical protein HCH_05309 [Hahella chejuensis KCTC 2396]
MENELFIRGGPLIGSVGFDGNSVHCAISDQIMNAAVHRLLLFDGRKAGETFADGNNLIMIAIAFHTDFTVGQLFLQNFLQCFGLHAPTPRYSLAELNEAFYPKQEPGPSYGLETICSDRRKLFF